MLQTILSYKFMMYIWTKFWNFFKQFVQRDFLISYVVSDKSKIQKIEKYYQYASLKQNLGIRFYKLFLHTNSLLMYKLSTVNF